MKNSEIFGEDYKKKYCEHCGEHERTPVYIIQTQKPKTGEIHILDSDEYNHMRIELNVGGGVKTLCGYDGSELPHNAETLISLSKRPLRFVSCEKCLKIFNKNDK